MRHVILSFALFNIFTLHIYGKYNKGNIKNEQLTIKKIKKNTIVKEKRLFILPKPTTEDLLTPSLLPIERKIPDNNFNLLTFPLQVKKLKTSHSKKMKHFIRIGGYHSINNGEIFYQLIDNKKLKITLDTAIAKLPIQKKNVWQYHTHIHTYYSIQKELTLQNDIEYQKDTHPTKNTYTQVLTNHFLIHNQKKYQGSLYYSLCEEKYVCAEHYIKGKWKHFWLKNKNIKPRLIIKVNYLKQKYSLDKGKNTTGIHLKPRLHLYKKYFTADLGSNIFLYKTAFHLLPTVMLQTYLFKKTVQPYFQIKNKYKNFILKNIKDQIPYITPITLKNEYQPFIIRWGTKAYLHSNYDHHIYLKYTISKNKPVWIVSKKNMPLLDYQNVNYYSLGSESVYRYQKKLQLLFSMQYYFYSLSKPSSYHPCIILYKKMYYQLYKKLYFIYSLHFLGKLNIFDNIQQQYKHMPSLWQHQWDVHYHFSQPFSCFFSYIYKTKTTVAHPMLAPLGQHTYFIGLMYGW